MVIKIKIVWIRHEIKENENNTEESMRDDGTLYLIRSEKLLKSPVLTHRRYNPMLSDLKVSKSTSFSLEIVSLLLRE